MNDYVTELTLDINCKAPPVVFKAGQFDKGRKIKISVTADGNTFDISNCTAMCRGIRNDKSHFAVSCSKLNNDIIVTLTEQMLSCKKEAIAKIVLSDGTRTYSTDRFIIDVDGALEGDITNSGDYSILIDLLEQVKEIAKIAKNAIPKENGAVISNYIADEAVTTNKIGYRAVTAAKLWGIDGIPKKNSTNLIFSGGVYQAIEDAKNEMKENLGLTNYYTKEESKSRFGLTVSGIYDENNILLQWRSYVTLGGGLFSGTNAKTAFIANNVVTVQSGAFIGCKNLETVYIDKPIEDLQQGRFYIQDGAFPPNVNIIYTDSFNAVTANAKAIAELNRKYNNSNTDTNIESGTGDLTNLNSNISIRYAMHSYQRVDNFVTLRIRVCVQANHLSGDLIFSGLPFNTQKYFYGVCISDLNNICKWTIDSTGLQIIKSDSSGWIHGNTEEFTFVATYEI